MNNSISVIIPTKNGGELFRESLEMIFSQEIDCPLEVVVIDSGSTDQTLEICADYPVKLIKISSSSFNHSTTRNKAIAESCGDICVLTVQDAVPVDTKWLVTLVGPLLKNNKIAGVFGQQVARDDASFFTRYCQHLYYREWRSNWEQEHEQLPVGIDEWDTFSIEERRIFSRFDNTNSCFRRSVWQKIPFPIVPFAEDVAWAIAVLTSGFSIVWKPEAQVFHSHERPLAYTLQRSYVDAKTLADLFGGNSPLMTHQMARSVVEWLSKEAFKYLRLTGNEQKEKGSGIEQIAEADCVWQLGVNAEKISGKNITVGYELGIFPGAATIKNFILRQYYKGILGPVWFRKMCRNIFRNGLLLGKKCDNGALNNPSIMLELQACHRYFTNLLFSVHCENRCKIVDSGGSIRFGAAIMVAGSFLGQHMKSVNSSPDVQTALNSNSGKECLTSDREVWQLLADWHKQNYTQDSTAISELDHILTDNV